MRLLVLILAVFLVGCESRDDALHIFAASSLTEAIHELGRDFREMTGTDVRVNIAGSQVLRMQIENGAATDVFASADEAHMQALVDAGLMREPVVFARNELVVIVPRDNPAGIESFEDLGSAKRLVLGTQNVPVGRYASESIERAGAVVDEFRQSVEESIVSRETNVRLVRSKVGLGESDAAIVYRTDASPEVRAIDIPARWNPQARYPIAVHSKSSRSEAAKAFVEYVLSKRGQDVLRRHGFVVEDE